MAARSPAGLEDTLFLVGTQLSLHGQSKGTRYAFVGTSVIKWYIDVFADRAALPTLLIHSVVT